MFCPTCGNNVVPGSKFCTNCGTAALHSATPTIQHERSPGLKWILPLLKDSPRLLFCYGVQLFALLIFSMFPVIGDGNAGLGAIVSIGARSNGLVFAKFMGFIFVAIYVMVFYRGLINRKKLRQSILIEAALVFIFTVILQGYIRKVGMQYYHSIRWWTPSSTEDIVFRWGFYSALIILAVSFVATFFINNAKQN